MKEYSTLSVFKILLLLVGCVLLMLTWFLVRSYLQQEQPPEISSYDSVVVQRDEAFSLDLHGRKFSPSDVSAILTPNIDNKQALVASLPLPGNFETVLRCGPFLYLGSIDKGLYVVNIQEPQNPHLVDHYLSEQPVVDILQVGSFLVIANGKNGLSIWDIQPNGALVFLSDLLVNKKVIKCCYANDHLFVAAGSEGILCINVENFKEPWVESQINNGFINNIGIVANDLITLAADGRGLERYKISQRGSLKKDGSFALSGRYKCSFFTADGVYVATDLGLNVFSNDVTGNLELEMVYTTLTAIEKIFPMGDGLYLFTNYSALIYLDPELQQLTSPFFFADKFRTFVAADNYLWLAGRGLGLRVMDINALSGNSEADLIPIPNAVADLYVDEGGIYFASFMQGASFLKQGTQDFDFQTFTRLTSTSFAVDNKHLFVAHMEQGTEVFDLDGTDHPKRIADWPSVKATQLAILDQFVITSRGITGLTCFDISDLSHPVKTDLLKNIHVLGLAVHNRKLFVASKKKGLLIFAVSERGNFTNLGSVALPFPMSHFSTIMDVKVVGNFAYIAAGDSGLMIVDIENPHRAKLISSLGIPHYSKGLLIYGNVAMVLNGDSGFTLVNISRPDQPFIVGKIESPGLSRAPQVMNDLLYLPRRTSSVLTVAAPVIAAEIKVKDSETMSVRFNGVAKPGRYNLNLANPSGLVVMKNVVTVRN